MPWAAVRVAGVIIRGRWPLSGQTPSSLLWIEGGRSLRELLGPSWASPCGSLRLATSLRFPAALVYRSRRQCLGVRRRATHPAAVQQRSVVAGVSGAVAVRWELCRLFSKSFPRFLSAAKPPSTAFSGVPMPGGGVRSSLLGLPGRSVFRTQTGKAAGGHEIWHHRPATHRYTTIPNHPGDMPEGTLRAILKQAGIEPEVFLQK
jgi:hypothetical protein